MGKNEILAKLNDIFRDAFGKDDLQIDFGTTPADIPGWDSLMQVSLIAMIEGEFRIGFSMDELVAMESVGGMIDLIEEKIR